MDGGIANEPIHKWGNCYSWMGGIANEAIRGWEGLRMRLFADEGNANDGLYNGIGCVYRFLVDKMLFVEIVYYVTI